ncbi:hypothetical protein AGDE_04604 [Angomonas deanei]|nr:hypothetical protein AGDE_04604 [Angomonas deanei]|eukprot:EPY39324.1 hypothetical protein AGDE_04604 [Angomonas deanei]
MIDTPVGSERAILFHCTAGKDRTGLMAALLLHALRVEEDTILEDYLLTNQLFRRPKRAADRKGGLTLDSASLDVLWGVDAAFLRETFRHMNGTYFGVDGYLKSVVGLTESDIDRLGSVLLEPAG